MEHGVSFVEVSLGNWDTHRDNAAGVRTLCDVLDPAMAALLGDLKQRGLLDTTLVIWMGEFGRTPHVGKQGGRDHYPQAWTSVLAGGGIKAGQAIGRTDKQGGTVEEGRVSAVDFMATVCKVLDIDYKQEFTHHDRAADPHRGQGREGGEGVVLKLGGAPSGALITEAVEAGGLLLDVGSGRLWLSMAPLGIGSSPVSRAARLGRHDGEATKVWMKVMPSQASQAMFGMRISLPPYGEQSDQPRSSARKTMMSGLGTPTVHAGPVAAATSRTEMRAWVIRLFAWVRCR